MAAEVLRLRGVGVRFDKSMLLRDVDWTAHSDESWVVIGPNGAGKTTLLQVAATLLTPTHGTVEVLGEPLDDADIADLRTRIGMSSSAIADQVPLSGEGHRPGPDRLVRHSRPGRRGLRLR